MEARFAGGTMGFSADAWRNAIEEAGTFRDAVLAYLAERDYHPSALVRVEIDGWLP